jgi:hypothetical protein
MVGVVGGGRTSGDVRLVGWLEPGVQGTAADSLTSTARSAATHPGAGYGPGVCA